MYGLKVYLVLIKTHLDIKRQNKQDKKKTKF